jgi:peroxiredoxin Q/BCP
MVKIEGKYPLAPQGELSFPRLKPVLLVFYPGNAICTRQLCNYRDRFAVLQKLPCDLIGISGDCIESHKQTATEHQLPFPLLSDPERKIIRLLGMQFLGIFPKRGYALVDRQGQVRWTHSHPLPFFFADANRLRDELIPLLECLNSNH